MRVERAAALRFNRSERSRDWSKKPRRIEVGRHPVRDPAPRESTHFTPSPANQLVPYAEDVNEEQTYHKLKHNRLANRIPSHALGHLTVRRLDILIKYNLLALHDQKQWLLRVRQVRRHENERHSKPQSVSDAFSLEESPMAVGTDE